MDNNPYLSNVTQTNGCRVWESPLANVKIKIPERMVEIFIKNIPKNLFEADILPHFERFGPIYQFRLLVDYENCNRGFAYLVYFYEKSALECLDVMGYFIIKERPGAMLDVERSQERSHLLALNIPSTLLDQEIESGFRNVYTELAGVSVRRNISPDTGTCTAILEFPDHKSALNAKRWSGVGSLNLWSRNVKILWADSEQIEILKTSSDEVKHVLAHNMPEDFDPDELGRLMCDFVFHHDIITIRPMRTDWMIEFSNTKAAREIFTRFNGKRLGNQTIFTEWVTHERLMLIHKVADFEFELRCLCIANYWDPPIFIYGRIIPITKTQICAVIIKNNRKNLFTTFFIEMMCEDLTEIHARVCETVFLILMELKEMPKKNVVVKCSNQFAVIVGGIVRLDQPILQPSTLMQREPLCLYLDEVYALSKMSHELIASQLLHDIHFEYKMILKDKKISHQFICGIQSGDNLLGCIDPIYRHGKPLKYLMDSRNMILAMCDRNSMSNFNFNHFPALHNINCLESPSCLRLKVDKVELIPLEVTQRQNVHYTFRPYIEFNYVDSYGPLRSYLNALFTGTRSGQGSTQLQLNDVEGQQTSNDSVFSFTDLKAAMPM